MRLWLFLIPLLLLTFWIGARGLDADSIWADEVYSIRDAGGPFFGPLTPADIWARVAQGNPWHTPGFFILLNGWSHLAGWSAPALRAFSLLLGMLAVAWTYRLGHDAFSPRVGLYAAVVLGTAAFYTHYLHEIRMYTLIVLLTAFTLWVYLRIVHGERQPTRLAWLGFAAGVVGLLYTHYLAALLLVAIGVYHLHLGVRLLLYHRQRPSHLSLIPHPSLLLTQHSALSPQSWLGVVGVMALGGVLFLPWAGVLLEGLSRTEGDDRLHARALGTGELIAQVGYLFSNGTLPLLAALIVLAFAPLRGWKARAAKQARAVVIMTAILMALILAANAALSIIPPSRVRYLLSLFPLLALVVGAGLARLGDWQIRARHVVLLHITLTRSPQVVALITLGVWALLGVWRSGDAGFTADVRSSWFVFPMHTLARDMQTRAQPGDLIVNFLPDDSDLWVYFNSFDIANYYFNGTAANYHVSMTLPYEYMRRQDWELMMSLLPDKQRVWAAFMPPDEPDVMTDFEAALAENFNTCGAPVDQPDLRVDLFARSTVCCVPDEDNPPSLIAYDRGITLTGVDPLPEEANGALPVLVGWSLGDDVPPYTYSVALHVVDADDKLVAQADYGLPYLAFSCPQATVDIRALSPGAYRLLVVVYAWETGERLVGRVTATGEQGERLPLGAFRVTGEVVSGP